VTVFICDNQGKCTNEGKELVTNINNRYNMLKFILKY
jgi:hypothetical protein